MANNQLILKFVIKLNMSLCTFRTCHSHFVLPIFALYSPYLYVFIICTIITAYINFVKLLVWA